MRVWAAATFLFLVAAPVAAEAQDAAGCDKFKWSIARERAWLATPEAIGASGEISLGDKAFRVALAAANAVNFDLTPERAAGAGTHAAVLTFTVAAAGNYDVTLSDEGWIDVVENGARVKSSDFSGAKSCPGVRKSVRFPLAAGAATLQISNVAADAISLAIAPAP